MSILKVARMGHPVLRAPTKTLSVKDIQTPEIQKLIDDMVETMHEYEGVGLAAPQVHESLKLAVIEFDPENPRYKDLGKKGLEVFINPKIEVLDETPRAFWEGCLSIPEIRALIYRPRKIRVTYLDRDAKKQTVEAEDFLAIVLQHELDHLDGVLFIDRVQPVPGATPIAFVEEYTKYDLPAQFEPTEELD